MKIWGYIDDDDKHTHTYTYKPKYFFLIKNKITKEE